MKNKLIIASLAGVLALTMLSHSAVAGVIAVFSDINYMDASSAGRDQALTNLLGSGTTVLASKQNAASFDTDFAGFYNGLAGVSGSFTGAELTSGALSGVDLLFLNFGCCSASDPQPYSASEILVIEGFLLSGGNLGIVSEPCCGATPTSMNAFMAGIGSSMTFGSHNVSGTGTINDTFLTAGVTSFNLITFVSINGGTAAVTNGDKVGVAFEYVDGERVPEPGVLGLLGLGLLGTGVASRRRKAIN